LPAEATLVERVMRLVSEAFHVPIGTVTPESTKNTISGWNSMAMLQLSVDVETEFEVSLSVDEAAELVSVKAIVQLLERKGLA
jgi:acyl carrier protein